MMKRLSVCLLLAMLWAPLLFLLPLPISFGQREDEAKKVSPLKGVCLSGGYANLEQVAELNVARALDWSVNLGAARRLKAIDIEYHPRLLLDKPELLPTDTAFRVRVERFANEFPGTTWFFYNEPELSWQHPVAPALAVELFDQLRIIILSVDPTARFVVGNITFGCVVGPDGNDAGTAWLRQFVEIYRASHTGQSPPVLGYGLHLYADCCEWRDGVGYMDYLDRAERFVERLHAGAEMWCTEWGALSSGERPIERVMETGVFWFETHSVPYFWFATYAEDPKWCPRCDGTLVEKGKLTMLGELYRNLPGIMYKEFLPVIRTERFPFLSRQ